MRRLDGEETRAALRHHGLDRPRGIGFAFRDQASGVFYDWHAHAYHQLIYAVSGTTQIETEQARYLLPTGRAAWIPAGVRHRTLVSQVEGASLYFEPDAAPGSESRVRILLASPVMREMILHALRWPLGATDKDPVAASFFQTLRLLVDEWLDSELPLALPRAAHPAIVRAMDYAAANPGAATQAGALAAAHLSERTFRRLFQHESGMTWQSWLGQARLLAAAALLAEGGRVTDVAAEVGYASLSAFAKAFSELMGEPPAAFKRRSGQPSGSRRPDHGEAPLTFDQHQAEP